VLKARPEVKIGGAHIGARRQFHIRVEEIMGTEREEWISKRAYELWEQAGRPEGQDSEQWAQASAEWESKSGKDGGKAANTVWDDEES
jgi:hypothetical protein